MRLTLKATSTTGVNETPRCLKSSWLRMLPGVTSVPSQLAGVLQLLSTLPVQSDWAAADGRYRARTQANRKCLAARCVLMCIFGLPPEEKADATEKSLFQCSVWS